MTLRRVAVAIAVAFGALCSPNASATEPVAITRAHIQHQIQDWQIRAPKDFHLVQRIISDQPRHRDRNGHWTGWYRHRLEKLSQGGTWAVVDVLIYHPAQLHAAPVKQRADLKIAMIGFLASRKNPSLVPVLTMVLFGHTASATEQTAAAIGLARLAAQGGQEPLLRALRSTRSTRQLAALRGLRTVRTDRALLEINKMLQNDHVSKKLTVEALRTIGYVGSSWAWQARPHQAHVASAETFRRRCAAIALRFALHGTGRVQRRAKLSVAMIAASPSDEPWLKDLARGLVTDTSSRLRWQRLQRTLRRWQARTSNR